jgi:transcriptional regulator with XRE-family HTH domain
MSTIDTKERKERLRHDLLDREYREQYATSTLIENVSAQVQALRRQRGMSQAQLAKDIGTKQPRISIIEAPPDGVGLPNWEVDTLNRIALALGTRLKISFETYGSLVDELDSVTSDSLRRVEFESDPVLFPRTAMPEPDSRAPERTRWMQEVVIQWLWGEKLELGRLVGWLQGRGLPPVGHDEEPHQWLLRGISIPGPARDFLERRLAERLAILLGEQPDVEPIVSDRQDDFLSNLYWTCAGMNRPAFMAEQLWLAYKRLRHTKLSGTVRDALQAALVQNQFGESKPLKEIWQPMVERGKHRWLRGDEIVGYEGIVLRHKTIARDLDRVIWALGRISHRWDATRQDDFKRLMWRVPELDRPEVQRQLFASATGKGGWSQWAREVLPIVEVTPAASVGDSEQDWLSVRVRVLDTEFYAEWRGGEGTRTGVRQGGNLIEPEEQWPFPGRPHLQVLKNVAVTQIGKFAEGSHSVSVETVGIAHAWMFADIRQDLVETCC